MTPNKASQHRNVAARAADLLCGAGTEDSFRESPEGGL
jgi:hypothetical protein